MPSMEENIRNYSKEISTIKSFAAAVRKTVGQYLGYTGNKGFINMIREIIQNSFDELQRETSPCDHVWIYYDEKNHIVKVRDNGRGIPFNDMIRVFSEQHTSSNYNKRAGEFTSGRHGVGSKVTNAVSEYFIEESYILGEAMTLTFKDGVPVGTPTPIPCNGYQGTIVTFKPAYEVMGEITTTYQEVLHLVKLLTPLLKIGAVVDFEAVDYNGNPYSEHIVNEDGIITFLINKTTSPLVKPIIFNNVSDTMKADIAFTYDSNDLMNADITGFSNFCPTVAGTHIEGFLEGVVKFFRDYMNKFYLNKSKITVVGNDIRCGLKAIVAVSHLEPIFTGQAKEILSNDDMFWYTRNLTIDYLTTWVKDNPNDLQRLCKYYKDVAELRVKSDESKVKLSQKYEASKVTGLPKKFIKPTGKPSDKLELIIVEGDSAAGSIKNYRDNVRQGLFPIRGKMPNAFTWSTKEFLENEEVSAILSIIGCGYGKNFDISKCKWDKIIIGADADPDGSHIRALFLKFMLMYCTPLITAGKFYSLVPPLYGFKPKNSKKKLYFTQKLDYIKYILALFSQQNVVTHAGTKAKYTQSESIELMFKNMEYVDIMDSIVTTFAANPYLIEDIVINRNSDLKTLSKYISKKYRFLTVEKMGNSMVIKGLLDDKYQTIIINDYLLNSIKPLEKYIDEAPKDIVLNGNPVTLYGLMKQFDAFVPRNSRFKGLGEMDGKELSESTVHPDSNRILMQYSIEDVKLEIEAIKAIETDKSVLLKDIKVTRLDID